MPASWQNEPTGDRYVSEVASIVHLARRFFGSLSPVAPTHGDEQWARAHLGPGEQALWRQMSNADRRHAVGVAQRVASALGSQATPPVLAAALLHDIGKIDSGLGTMARAGATVWAGVRGRDRLRTGDGRVARYLRHDEIGSQLLLAAEADPLTIAWAREHHLDPSRWSVPANLASALKDADDD
jgi:hypothetical protein